MSIYADSIRQRWPKMEEGWISDLAALMQQVVDAQLPELEKDLRQQLAVERTGRDEYAIENHRLRGEMAKVQDENKKLSALASPPIDEISAILYPPSFSKAGRREFAKAVGAVADWLEVVAPERVPDAITEPTVTETVIESIQEPDIPADPGVADPEPPSVASTETTDQVS